MRIFTSKAHAKNEEKRNIKKSKSFQTDVKKVNIYKTVENENTVTSVCSNKPFGE